MNRKLPKKKSGKFLLFILISFGFFLSQVWLSSGKVRATPKLKFFHKDKGVNHKCKFCHHRNPRKCSICHTSGVKKETTFNDLSHKIKRMHEKCRKCHKKKVKIQSQERLKLYVRKQSKCLKCHP